MPRIQWRPWGAGRIGLLLAICALAVPRPGGAAAAEFAVGSKLPAFSLQTPDGKTAVLEHGAEGIQLSVDGKAERPKALAIHLLQPDCLQCRAQLKALQSLHARFAPRGLAVVGVSHRGDERALAELARELDIKFPMLHGAGSELAKQFAAGDTFGLVDRQGVVRFAQVGYGVGDEKTWTENVERLLAGEPVAKEGVDRERLKAGDPFPAIVLPDLRSGKPMELVGKDGKLLFRGADGKETRPKGAVGFFSRY